MATRKLTLIDQGFLLAETQERPTHIASLQIFELPPRKGPSYLRRLIAELNDSPAGPPFDCRLNSKSGPFRSLVTDEHFDIDYHVRHSVLPAPGSDEQLQKLIARLHANMLDRGHPLWEFHVIEGLAGRRFATYTKIHHAYCDGATFSKWAVDSMGNSPSDVARAIWDRAPQRSGDRIEYNWISQLTRTADFAGKALKSIADVSDLGRRLLGKSLLSRDPAIVLPLGAPKTSLNIEPGASRSVAGISFSLREIKRYGRAHDATVNDVVLAMTDYALSLYLGERGNKPDEPLVAVVPVNLRQPGDQSEGNHVSILQIRLSSEFNDFADCLRQVRDSASSTKEVFETASIAAAQSYVVFTSTVAIISSQLGLGDNMRIPGNLIVSNVPGPKKTLYLKDSKLLNIYPISALAPMTALNVTVYSYAGQLQFGLIAGRRAVPELGNVVVYLKQAFDEILGDNGE